MKTVPYRQIHLDFHTSPLIPEVGEAFNPQEFVNTLKENHINSINLFCKCHHGFYYYPTKLGHVHPNLKPGLDLFGEQLKACRSAGIRTLAYTTVVWAEDTCDQHPEWMQIDENGVLGARRPFNGHYNTDERAWRSLCMNNREYVEYMKAELKEIYDNYHPDGFWIDIIFQFHCICPSCRKEMHELGLNIQNTDDVMKHDRMVEIRFAKEIRAYIRSLDPMLEVYFNGCPAEFDQNDLPDLSTAQRRLSDDFMDIESLPSEIWGYAHFPVLVNYVNRFDTPLTMMNGKFHKTWGDFGTLRNIAALEYEAFRALANGAGICVGDQLHPCGRLDPTVYRRIGDVMAQIEKKEPYCIGSRKLARVAAYAGNRVLENERSFTATTMSINGTNEGVYRVLSELKIPFDFVDFADDISKYELVILPDHVRLPEKNARQLSNYIANGGKVLLTGESGLKYDEDQYALEEAGVDYVGAETYSVAYMEVSEDQFPNLPAMYHTLYKRGIEVKVRSGKVLSRLVNSYFNRTFDHFCSHRQTPPCITPSEKPLIIDNGSVITVTHPLFADYAENGCKIYKDVLGQLIDRLISPIIRSNLPSTAEVTLRELNGDVILHVLSYSPVKRCRTVEIIEDTIPLHDVEISIRMDNPPIGARLVPQDIPLPLDYRDGYAQICIPKVCGHQMVSFECRH